MRLIMCCQKIDGRDFRSDLRFSVIAAAFWKRVYPDGEVWLGTNTSDVPEAYKRHITVVEFPFGKYPAFGRTNFMTNYLHSPMFDRDTVFTGHDVVFLKPLPTFEAKGVTNYRYHPSQPYCSDLFIAKDKAYCSELFREILQAHQWMPRPIVDGAGDQLAYTVTLGMPEAYMFNGQPFRTPRRPDILAVPAHEYLFTHNDGFPPNYRDFLRMSADTISFEDMLMAKTAVHFKGNRKKEFFQFGHWAYQQGHIQTDVFPENELFAV